MTIPYAVQKLNNSNQIVRTGECPEHKKISSKFQGMQEIDGKKGWTFLCTESKLTTKTRGHIFINLQPRGTPETAEELIEWTKKQMMDRVKNFDKNGRTKK